MKFRQANLYIFIYFKAGIGIWVDFGDDRRYYQIQVNIPFSSLN